jgi:predicted RNA binding protein YcfA (HicA-like mRNA interferase family)
MHPELKNINSREVERLLIKAGFILDRQKGSHLQYLRMMKGKILRVTVVANRKSYSIDTLKTMIAQSGLSEDEWVELKNK